MQSPVSSRVRFGAFELDLTTGELRSTHTAGSKNIILREQAFQVLRMLVERPGKIVSREEIRSRLWPNDTVVDFDQSINATIKTLRRNLRDSADNPQYIETLARRGYRLMVATEYLESAPGITPGASAPAYAEARGLIGKKVSHYRVLEVIGGGGMGMVYRAEDLKLGRSVALKFLPEELTGDAVALERFEREARTASSLNHPNICTVHAIEEHDGKPFMAMELLEGETLRTRMAALEPKALPFNEFFGIATQVCSGLEAAHEKGIIHRDIKPANIFLCKSGTVKILDFGLAKLASYHASFENAEAASASAPATPSADILKKGLTLTGTTAGTAGYMSPEQVRREELDTRTDIFSFGLVLYEMVTGCRAFPGESIEAVHEAILYRTPSSARALNSEVPRRLNTIIGKALEKDRARRYQSAAEMRKDLLLAGKELRPGIHLPRSWLAIAATALVLFTAGTLYWRLHSRITLSSSDTLVVADMNDQTGDAALEDGLNLALQVALQQTPYLNLLSGDKVHETLRQLQLGELSGNAPLPSSSNDGQVPNHTHASPLLEDTRITPEVGAQVCRKTNSRAVISASIADAGNRFRIGLSAIDCQSGKTLEQVVQEAETRDDIVRTFGLAATELRLKLGESRDSVRRFNQPLDQATSSSPDALQFLALGYKKHLRGDIPGALAYYQRAIEKDPNLALAYAAEASGNNSLGKDTLALIDSDKAFELRNRLTGPSRFQVETLYYADRNQWDKECPISQEWVQAFPRDIIARINFSSCLQYLGRHDEELVQAREGARLLPSAPTLMHLVTAAIFTQRFDEARAAYEEAVSRGFDSDALHLHHARLAFLQNDKSGMQKEWVWAAQDPVRGRFVLYHQSEIEGFYGRFRNALRLAQMNADSSMKAGFLSDAAGFESADALSDAEIGNLRESQTLVTDALRKSQDRTVLMWAAFTFARAGDTKQSQKLVERLSQLFPDDFTVQAFSLPATRAAIKLAEHDPAAAIEILRPVTPYDLAISYSFDNVYPAYLRGLAYLQLKQGDLAAAEFRKVLDHSGIVQGFVTGALSILQLGRAQVLMHDEQAARKSYEDFLALWKNADPDLLLYKEAKAEYAALLAAKKSR